MSSLDWLSDLFGYNDPKAPVKKPAAPVNVPTRQAPSLRPAPSLWDTVKGDLYKAAQAGVTSADSAAQGAKDFVGNFVPGFKDAASRSMVGSGVRELAYRTGAYQQPNESDSQYRQRIATAERNRRQTYDSSQYQTPDGQPDASALVGSLVGHLLGGVDPSYLLAPGDSALMRIGTQGGLQGVSSMDRQEFDKAQGIQSNIDYKRVGEDTLGGMALQGAGELIHGAIPRNTSELPPAAQDYLNTRAGTPPATPGYDYLNDTPVPEVEPDFRTRREKIQDATAHLDATAKPGSTATTQPFPDEEPDYFRFKHVTPDGKAVNGTYTYDPNAGVIDNFSIHGDGANSVGPSTVRAIGRDLADEHPDAQALRAYRTSGARANQGGGENFVDIPLNRTPEPVAPEHPGLEPIPGEPELLPAERILRRVQQEGYTPNEHEQRILDQQLNEDGKFFDDQADKHGYEAATREYIGEPDGQPKFPEEGGISPPNKIHPDEPVAAFNHETGQMYGPFSNIRDARKTAPGHIYADQYGNTDSNFGPLESGEAGPVVGKLASFLRNLGKDEQGSVPVDDGEEGHNGPEERIPDENKGPQPAAVRKLIAAIKKAKPARSEQEALRSEELSKRVGKAAGVSKTTSGLEGLAAEKAALGGQMPQAHYEPVADQFTPEEIASLTEHIKNHPRLSYLDTVHAREGLERLLHGTVPTKSQLSLIDQIFPKDLTDELMNKRPLDDRISDFISNAVNLPKSIMASMDFSAPLRQGAFLIGRKEFYPAFWNMFKQFGSDEAFNAVRDEIASRPTHELMEKSGLALTKIGSDLSQREEAFMSNWADKIPVIGKGIKASERAYQGFLNKLRADVFDSLVKDSHEAGIDFDKNSRALKDIANFINAATGRGSLGKLNQSVPLMNALLWSPRLMASRIELLSPRTYLPGKVGGKYQNPVVTKAAQKALMTFAGMALTVLGLAKAGGAEVEDSPYSSDFGKIKIGNTRFDALGGFGQYITFAAREIMDKTKSSETGKMSDIDSDKFGSPTSLSVLETFLRNKASPVIGTGIDLKTGKNTAGQPVTVKGEAAGLVTPLVGQDVYQSVQANGPAGAAVAVPSMFGIGVQTYTPNKPKWAEGLSPNTVKELQSLHPDTNPDAPIVSSAPKSIKVGKESVSLDQNEQKDYQSMSASLFDGRVQDLQNDPDYAFMTDDEKRSAIRKAMSQSRKDARELLFPDADSMASDTPEADQ